MTLTAPVGMIEPERDRVPGGHWVLDMTTSPLVERAKQGDVQAIATLIRRMLPTDVHVHVSAVGDHLSITLETFQPPQSSVLVPRLERGLTQLQPAQITTVRIDTRQPGAAQSDWHAEFSIVPVGDSVSASESAEPTHQPPATTDLGLLFLQRFNWLKVAFLVMLAIHSIFGSHNYTVSGFLNSGDFLMMFLHNVNLIFHEAGHTILMMFGRFIHLVGGSLMQILVPAGLSVYFWLTRQGYASAIALWWAGQNFLDVSIYIKDARERLLPLLGGEGVMHDWHFILLDLRLLPYDDVVGNLAYGIGILIYIGAIALGLYYCQSHLEADQSEPSDLIAMIRMRR